MRLAGLPTEGLQIVSWHAEWRGITDYRPSGGSVSCGAPLQVDSVVFVWLSCYPVVARGLPGLAQRAKPA